MNPLSSRQKTVERIFFVCLTMLLILFPSKSSAAQSDRHRLFNKYGFTAIGFSSEQEEIIKTTLASFDEALGGRGRLARIIRTYNSGENWTISYVSDWKGADSSMKLSPTVFNIQKAQESNYSSYGTNDEAIHSQIVIGHEISHLLIRAVRDRTGVIWSKTYQQRVARDWERINDPKAPEEEAVTQLSLKVMKVGYYFSINEDVPENNPDTLTAIDAWSVDFLSVLQKLN